MKQRFLILLSFLFLLSCSNLDDERWKQTLTENNFESYFRYVIHSTNKENLAVAIDSLSGKYYPDSIISVMPIKHPDFETNALWEYYMMIRYPDDDIGMIRKNNVLEINIAKDGTISFNDPDCNLNELKEYYHEFILNPNELEHLSVKVSKNIPDIGERKISKGLFAIYLEFDSDNEMVVNLGKVHELFIKMHSYHQELVDASSLAEYDLPYTKLNQHQREIINHLRPFGCLIIFKQRRRGVFHKN